MKKLRLYLLIIYLLLLPWLNILAQSPTAYGFITSPGSISSYGMGMQSVALKSSDDALTWNPANLVYSNGTGLSYFRNPFRGTAVDIPHSYLVLHFNYPNAGAFAVEYNKLNIGEWPVTNAQFPDGTGRTFRFYEESYSAGFARELTDEISAGIALRYVSDHMGTISGSTFMAGAGINYVPSILDKRLKFSLSLMNVGSKANFEDSFNGNTRKYSKNLPTLLSLGLNSDIVDNGLLNLSLQIAGSKDLSELDENLQAQTSFESIFSDWQNFPEDAILHSGLSVKFKPVSLTKDLSFFHSYYLGNFSRGIWDGVQSFYTHGIDIGVQYRFLRLSAGYAGLWHYVDYYYEFMPVEALQINLGFNGDLITWTPTGNESLQFKDLYISAGTGFSIFQDQLIITRDSEFENMMYNTSAYSLQAAFYLSSRSALTAELTYRRVIDNKIVKSPPYPYNYISPLDYVYSHNYAGRHNYTNETFRSETFSLITSYRYHAVEELSPLYFEGGLGIIRINPLWDSAPKYYYRPILKAAAGYIFSISERFTASPELTYLLVPTYTYGNFHNNMGGYNQINAGMRLGLRL